jgi:DNA invertase Pin-like site-specific DNA recombinase
MASGRYVAYYRVSTQEQGRSGLGLDAQREAVSRYLNGGTWTLDAEYTEIESGKRNDRPKLAEAIKLAKRLKATLIIAKMDRLGRNLAFIANLMESGVEFVAVDNPNANRLTIHILAAVAQHEREMISQRTKEALQAAKRAGKTLGNRTNLREAQAMGRAARTSIADQRAENVMPIIRQVQAAGLKSLRAIAQALNDRGVKTPRGGEWHAKQVQLVLNRSA